jgi:hypothetical protein
LRRSLVPTIVPLANRDLDRWRPDHSSAGRPGTSRASFSPTLLRDGNGLLLDFGRQASLQALDGLWGDHVRYVASDAKDRLGLSALLVRPDGFVAWASDTTPSPEEVTRAAARWFARREHHAISR